MNPELNVFAFIQGAFGTALNGAVAQSVQSGLQFSHSWLRVAGAFWILTTAGMALLNRLGMATLIQRTLRTTIVAALITQTNLYDRFVVQPVTTGIQNQIAQAFGGPNAQTMPQQFATVYTNIGKMASQLREQANGLFYLADRFAIWFAELCCKFLLVPEYVLYVILTMFIALLVIAGTLVLIFFMFDFTKAFAEAWLGSVIGALVTVALMSVSLQLIFEMNVSYMQQFTNLPLNNHGLGLNVSEGAEILVNIAVMFLVGFFLMCTAFVIGFSIGRNAGISATAALTRFIKPL